MATRRKSTRKRRVSGTAAVGRTRRRRSHTSHSAPAKRRRVSGTAAVGSTHRRRRRSVGASTSAKSMVKQIIPMAVGMGIGVGVQHFVLRPLEAKIAQRAPGAARWFALGEILLGGAIALKAKHPVVKGVGLGIMAGGVQTGAKQLKIYRENPAVQGVGDYTTVQIPVNGQVQEMLSGIIRNRNGITNSSLVAGSGLGDYDMGEVAEDAYLQPKGVFGDADMGFSQDSQDRINRTNTLAGIWNLY